MRVRIKVKINRRRVVASALTSAAVTTSMTLTVIQGVPITFPRPVTPILHVPRASKAPAPERLVARLSVRSVPAPRVLEVRSGEPPLARPPVEIPDAPSMTSVIPSFTPLSIPEADPPFRFRVRRRRSLKADEAGTLTLFGSEAEFQAEGKNAITMRVSRSYPVPGGYVFIGFAESKLNLTLDDSGAGSALDQFGSRFRALATAARQVEWRVTW